MANMFTVYRLLVTVLSVRFTSSKVIYVNGANVKNGDGSAWSSAYKYLQDGLASGSTGDKIWIAKGTYYPTNQQSSTDRSASFLLTTALSIYGGFNGSETRINQRHSPLPETILSGNIGDSSVYTDNSYHVIELQALHALLDGLVIEGGYATNDSISNYPDCPTCFGGGLYDGCFQARSQQQVHLTINQCTFRDNTALSGGAIFAMCTSNYVINNSVFERNTALSSEYKGGYGGAIMLAYMGQMNVSNTVFQNNIADGSGGAAHCDYGMICRYNACMFDSNIAKQGNGGALTLIDRDSQRGFSNLYVNECQFVNNMAQNTVKGSAGYGGAIFVFDNDASGFITNSIFNGNTANLGGAMAIYGDSHCASCCQPTFSGNSFTSNVGKNGFDECYIAGFPTFDHVPNTVSNPLTYLALLYAQRASFVDPNTPPMSANVVYVNMNSKASYPNGSSWSNAFKSLQDGIDAAAQILYTKRTTTVEVWVAGSALYETQKYIPERVPTWYNTSASYYDAMKSKMIEIPANIRLFGGFAGTESNREDRDWLSYPTLIDGYVSDTQQVYQVVYVHDNVYLDGFMIANGCALGPPSGDIADSFSQTNPNQVLLDPTPDRGSGIFANVTELNVANVLFYGHFSRKGSGLYVLGNPSFTHNVSGYNLGFVANYATDRGGALAVDLFGQVNCIGCSFWNNVCSHKGGAIYSDFSSHSVLDQCTVYNNTAFDSGGGMAMDAGYSQITNSNFTENYAFSQGGATYTGSYNPFAVGDERLPNHYLFKNNYYKDNQCASGNRNHYLWTYDYWVAVP